MLRQPLANMLPQLRAPYETLIEKTQLIAAKTQIDVSNPAINVLLETATEADAQEVEKAWVELASVMFTLAANQSVSRSAEGLVGTSMKNYLVRANKEFTATITPTRKGNRLLLTLDQRALALWQGLATYINLQSAVADIRQSMPRAGSPLGSTDANKLKELGLALHNFESAYRRLPSTGGEGPGQQVKLSWRVQLLPFIGDPKLAQLYQQFQLNEPWDSETNIKLLDQMPSIYRYSKAKAPEGHTVIQMPLGPGLISEPKAMMKFGNVTDGLSNTILFTVSTDEAAVPWTKPDDFNPLENLQLLRRENGSILACMADGAINLIPDNTGEARLKALLTRSGD
jgi:hypothetical protein